MIDLIGKRFNNLVVIKKYDNSNDKGRKRVKWICKCDCGNITIFSSDNLKSGKIKSCGCKGYQRNVIIPKDEKYKRLYSIWSNIKQRCYNRKDTSYKYYGARNIKICNEWKHNFLEFANWALNNGYSNNLTIDRIDVNGDYCPSNCRWVTRSVQNRNKTNNHIIQYNGISLTLTEWSTIYGINANTLRDRLKKGIKFEYAIVTEENKEKEIYNKITSQILSKVFDKFYNEQKLWCEKNTKELSILKEYFKEFL